MNVINAELLNQTTGSLKFILNDSAIVFFPATQQHRDTKSHGLSYEDDYLGNAVAGIVMPERVEIRFHKAFSDDRVRSIWRSVLSCPELARARFEQLYYQGRASFSCVTARNFMKAIFLTLLLSTLSVLAAEPVSFTRTVREYRVTIVLTDDDPRSISSISVQRGKQRFTLPASLFDDIRSPHLGPGFKAAKFRFEVDRKKAFVRITAGAGKFPDDHAWVLSLPLSDASRITRVGDVTGYVETRPLTLLTK